MNEQGFFSELASLFFGDIFLRTIDLFVTTAVVWLPILLSFTFWNIWIRWRRKEFLQTKPTTLLEVILSSEIERSPKAMEAVFNGLHVTSGESTWFDRFVKGKMRRQYSFELASIEGKIHFYIHTRIEMKDLVESQIYGQYPEVEIKEVKDDYTRHIQFVKGKTFGWGCLYGLTKPDSYPIKTYIDYGLDREGIDQEERVDPMASVFEWMSSLGPGEQAWIQIIMHATKNRDRIKPGHIFKTEGWQDEAMRVVEKLRRENTLTQIDPVTGSTIRLDPTKAQQEVTSAIERSVGKHGFECGIRGIYWAEADKFRGVNISGIVTAMKHYSTNNLNGIVPKYVSDFDYPWEDYKQIREHYRLRILLNAYRRRSWFYPPMKKRPYVLNSEELATIYHFPGNVVQAPGLTRIDSKRSGAPSNLPI